MAPQPDQLGRGEAGHRFDADDFRKIGMARRKLARLGEGPRVVMQDGGAQRQPVGGQADQPVLLPRHLVRTEIVLESGT